MQSSPSTISLNRWINIIDSEYLSDYIQSGGSAVKVITGDTGTLEKASALVHEKAIQYGYYAIDIDPGMVNDQGKRPDLHRIENFFFSATRNVDWKLWAEKQARQYLESRGIYLDANRRLNDIEGIAEDNERDAQDLLNQYQRELATPQIKDPRLSIEFRAAITALSRSLLIPDSISPTTEEVLLNWFRGKSVPGALSALKKVQIFERINTGNARAMLTSFCRWLPNTGKHGLVATLDFRPYEYKKVSKSKRQQEQLRELHDAIAQGASNEELTAIKNHEKWIEPDVIYSDAAYMQMLTMVRRFIDEVGIFERFLLIILTSPNFYKDKSIERDVKRCYFDYDALQTRIGQEVHDASHANPAASLVYLGSNE